MPNSLLGQWLGINLNYGDSTPMPGVSKPTFFAPTSYSSASSTSGFTGLGDLIVGKETNKTVQTVALAALVVGAIYLFKGFK